MAETVNGLRKKHKLYDERVSDWNFYNLAYEGGKPFIKYAIGDRHPRESENNYRSRINDGILINYSAAIIDIFNFYLAEKTPLRNLTEIDLVDDTLWEMFLKNCDYYGSDFDNFMNDAHKWATVCGSVGLLVTKPNSDASSIADEKRNRIYPYIALYKPQGIYDWAYSPHPMTGVPCLSYLKLREESSGAERYLIWTLDSWSFYEIKREDNGREYVLQKENGENKLGEIPFVWLHNIKMAGNNTHGKSDLVDVAPIVASLVRNMSSGDEIIKFAGFPIFKEPMLPDGVDDDDEVPVGVTAVKSFHKDYGEPGWIESAVLEPITAILSWMNHKADELYRAVHLSGIHGQRKSANSQASGMALRYEFQQLKTVLGRKADSVAESERQIIRLWCLWQGRIVAEENIDAKRSKDFSVDDLAMDLENMIVSMKAAVSERFRVLVQKKIARRTLADMSDADHKLIDAELEASKGKIEFDEKGHRRQDVPLPRKQAGPSNEE